MNGLPFGAGGRNVDGDPVEIEFVGIVKLAVESGGVVVGGVWHLANDGCAVGRSRMLQVNSLSPFGQLSIRNQK